MNTNVAPTPENLDVQITSNKKRLAKLQTLLASQAKINEMEVQLVRARCPHLKSIRVITGAVCEFYSLSFSVITSRDRTELVARARQVVFYIARKIDSRLSLPAIGKYFNRDHGTVIHGIRAVEAMRDTNQTFAAELSSIETACVEALTS